MPTDAGKMGKGCLACSVLGLGIGCLGIIVVVAAMAAGLFGAYQSITTSEPYQLALEQTRSSEAAIQALGTPIEEGMVTSGGLRHSDGVSETNIEIPVAGPDGSGTLFVSAEKPGTQWLLTTLELEMAGSAGRIDLLQGQPTTQIPPMPAQPPIVSPPDVSEPRTVAQPSPLPGQRPAPPFPRPGTPAPAGDATHDSCVPNLRTIYFSLKAYAKAADKEFWPPLDPRPGRLMFPADGVFPTHLADPRMLVCPGLDEDLANQVPPDTPGPALDRFFDDASYWYLGYTMLTEQEGLAFVEAYRKSVAAGAVPTGNLTVEPGTGMSGGDTIMRLREGIQRFFITDINDMSSAEKAGAEIPVVIERPGRHSAPGGYVVFIDGHTEFMAYPGKFPMTTRFIEALQSLDALEPAS